MTPRSALSDVPVGILGFVIMLGSATYGLAVVRGHATPTPAVRAAAVERTSHGFPDGHGARRPRKPRGSGSFMERMESRWRKRRDDGSGF